MQQFLCHLFLPHDTNNHRARLLHHDSIIFVIAFFLFAQVFLLTLSQHFPHVLGASIDLSTQDLLLLTNQKRAANHKEPLVLNQELSEAARAKAKDMLGKDYWAHQAPDGTKPWVFVKNAGYEYVYAGENLARGFTSSSDVINAWMESPSHKDNMLSENYQEVGFAAVQGKLLGEDTTLIVEMLGSRNQGLVADRPTANTVPSEVGNVLPVATNIFEKQSFFDSLQKKTIVPTKILSPLLAYIILGLFLFLLITDMIIIHKRKIVRHVGHNLDHIAFFVFVLVLIVISRTGIII